MSLDLWTAVDRYVNEQIVFEDDVLREATEAAVREGLPAIAVTPSQGKLLFLLARLRVARHILEIGTLAGYSTIWLGRGLAPGGRVVTIEVEARHAAIAAANIARAGLVASVDILCGRALDILPTLASRPSFDLIFIDADKEHVPEYFDWAVTLGSPGALIIIDNVVRDGRLIESSTVDPSVLGVRGLHDRIAHQPRLQATTIQTVGAKGYDGMTIAVVAS
jgi:predicted O-methyltransferase YrrM